MSTNFDEMFTMNKDRKHEMNDVAPRPRRTRINSNGSETIPKMAGVQVRMGFRHISAFRKGEHTLSLDHDVLGHRNGSTRARWGYFLAWSTIQLAPRSRREPHYVVSVCGCRSKHVLSSLSEAVESAARVQHLHVEIGKARVILSQHEALEGALPVANQHSIPQILQAHVDLSLITDSLSSETFGGGESEILTLRVPLELRSLLNLFQLDMNGERRHVHAHDGRKRDVWLEGDRDPASAFERFAGPLMFGPVSALTLCSKCQHM